MFVYLTLFKLCLTMFGMKTNTRLTHGRYKLNRVSKRISYNFHTFRVVRKCSYGCKEVRCTFYYTTYITPDIC
uniref:Putative secreted peptide n=1 Tax=Anopheles braziliensis TaxID=58242 RepID=A0A2M3ZV18_9DIPT